MDLEHIRQAIAEGNKKFSERFRQGDAGAVADLYTEDAVLLPQNSDKIIGKAGVEAFWAGGMFSYLLVLVFLRLLDSRSPVSLPAQS
jgi:ketosteroid isomerase-like protein